MADDAGTERRLSDSELFNCNILRKYSFRRAGVVVGLNPSKTDARDCPLVVRIGVRASDIASPAVAGTRSVADKKRLRAMMNKIRFVVFLLRNSTHNQ